MTTLGIGGVLGIVLFVLPTRIGSFPGQDCTEPCLSQMQMAMDDMPTNGGMPWSQFFPKSQNKEVMKNFFEKICGAYEKVDTCLADCERRSRTGVNIRQTYAGLKYICRDFRQDFFEALPCLAEHEPAAMDKCNRQINQSHATTAQFTEAIVNRETHAIRNRFRSLCTDLSGMIKCMEPIIRSGCGDAATNMMLKFITLEFASFEQLYSQLGFAEPLPSPCRSLLSLPTTPPEAYKPLPNEIVFTKQGSRAAPSRAATPALRWEWWLAAAWVAADLFFTAQIR